MIKTAVKWNDIHTQEQTAMFDAKASEIYEQYPDFDIPGIISDLQGTLFNPYIRVVYRTWPNEAAAQEWANFLLNANFVHLESAAVIVE
jgi:hypothetical protein